MFKRHSGRAGRVLYTAILSTAAVLPVSAAAGAVTYDNDISQLIKDRCSECHGADAPSMAEFKADKEKYKKDKLGPRMDTYENMMVMVNGSDTGAVMRRLDDGANTKDGQPGNMHKHLGKTDEERAANLAKVKAWIGGWTLKRSAEISEDERKAILAPR
jgi:mono/diheme cytochrome c family protein